MYNESDLKTVHYAHRGGMKTYQLSQLMGVSESEIIKMVDAAQALYGRRVGRPREESETTKAKRNSMLFFRKEQNQEPPVKLVRPAARYDNKSSEERINELLNTQI